jgi:predicted transcriptional regulator
LKSHFDTVVGNLTREDLLFMNELFTNDATNNYKAIAKDSIIEQTNLTQATFRNIVTRLTVLEFISIYNNRRNPMYSLTDWGLLAINKLTEGIEA